LKDILYAVPKAFALKGRLIDPMFLRRLVHAENLQRMTELMRNTPYHEKLAVIKEPTGIILEKVFRNSLVEDEIKLSRFVEGKRRKFLNALFSRHEIDNLKLFLKALVRGIPRNIFLERINLDVEKHLDKRALFVELLASDSIHEASLILKELGYELDLESLVKDERAELIDFLLDKNFYINLLEALSLLGKEESGDILHVFSPRIDKYNLMLVLRSSFLGLSLDEIEKLLVKNPKGIPLKELIEAPSATLEDLAKILRTYGYSEIPLSKELSPVKLEKELMRIHYNRAETLFLGKTITIKPVVGAMLLKEREVLNLVAIVYGVERRLPPSTILEEIII